MLVFSAADLEDFLEPPPVVEVLARNQFTRVTRVLCIIAGKMK
jgi:hypothetical protein